MIVIGSRLGSFALLERCFQGIPLDDDRPNHVNRRYAADGSPSNSLPACSRSMRCLANDRVPRLFAFAHIRTLGKRNMRPNGRLLHLTSCLDATERSRDAMNESLLENVMPDTTKVRASIIAPWNSLIGSSRRSRRSAGPSATSSSRSRSSLPRWRRPGSARFVQHIASVAQDYQDGIFAGTNDVIETITGKPPLTLEEFVSRNCAKFTV